VTFTNFLDGAANPVGFVLSEGTSGGTPGLVTANAGPNASGAEFRTRSPLQASIRAVLDNGKARLLSNPNTTVLSGRTATFQVGGQVPIPGSTTVTNSGSTTAIVFKDFGVLVDVVPSARLDGVVTMRVRTEVSQPDFTFGVTPPGGGSAIPGFQRRSAVTEVTVKPGGTIALAGLIQNKSRQLIRRVPLLSQIPVLGALFTSKRFQNDETELAIFVTPRVLANPLKPGEVAPAAPIPVGNTTNISTTTGNPGITSFNNGGVFSSPSVGGGGGQ
jgi:pilus assembly protein CpaC